MNYSASETQFLCKRSEILSQIKTLLKSLATILLSMSVCAQSSTLGCKLIWTLHYGYGRPLQVSFTERFLALFDLKHYLKHNHYTLYINEKAGKSTIHQKLHCFSLISNGKPNWAWQFEMDNVSLSELIAYQFWLQKLKLLHSPNP